MDKRSSRDMLSDLPLSIIHNILALVPIREAVKTSILSRQWRYRWASLPHLAFDDTCVSNANDETSLCHFITQALFLHKGPIHKFELLVSYMENFHYIDQWLLFLSRNDIRMLILNYEDSEYCFEVNSSLYSCQSLTLLKLFNCEIPPPPPTFKGFLCLRCLFLRDVDVSSDTVEILVTPLLEELTLDNVKSRSSELSIRAPNLKYFYLCGMYGHICLYAPHLAKMSARLCYFPAQQKSLVCNYTKFLGGFTDLEELSASLSFIQYLSVGIESCHRSLVFHHLRIIDLFGVIYEDANLISVIVRLIMGAPTLHKLKITSFPASRTASPVHVISLQDSEFGRNFTSERLKIIEMGGVSGLLNEMKLIKFLLESSSALETVIFKAASCLDDQKLLNLTAELLRYRRASENAEILFSKLERIVFSS